jgi:hypothetical protein
MHFQPCLMFMIKVMSLSIGVYLIVYVKAENTTGGSITVLLTSCLTGLDKSVLQIKTKLSVVIQLIQNQTNWRSMVQ